LLIFVFFGLCRKLGQSFIIDKEGALLGRKISNTIPLLMRVSESCDHVTLWFHFVAGCCSLVMFDVNPLALRLVAVAQLQLPTGEERVVNVDTAISSEHARVEFEPATGQFFICDGTPTKPSTNGTWYRYALSIPLSNQLMFGLLFDSHLRRFPDS
jgi:hypothetical protein